MDNVHTVEIISGVRITDTVRSRDKIVPYLSVGLEYDISRRMTLSCSVSNTFKTGQIPRLTTVSVGLQYLLVKVDK